MSMLTVYNRNGTTLATSQLVYSPDEVEAVDSVIKKIELLDMKLAKAEEDIQTALEEARELGEKEGFARGRAIARRKISIALLTSQRDVNRQREQLHDSSVELALEIVRRIGLTSPPAETLISLAKNSARELSPNEKATLCVHPEHEKEVKNRLLNTSNEEIQWLLEVAVDDSIEPQDCVLKTAHGSLFVGLESQLRIIERSLNERVN